MLTIALSIVCLTTQLSSAPDTERLTSQIERHVRDLDHAERSTREAAERALVDLGVDALSHLPPVDDNTPAEVKERLARVRLVLEQRAAASSSDASRLTLQGTFTFAEVISEIERQTNNRLVDFRDRFGQQQSDLTLKLDIVDQPFWKALDQILDQAGLTVYTLVGQTRALGIVSKPNAERDRLNAGCYAGLFRIAATYIEAKRNLRNSNDQSLWLRLELLWEPRTAPILIQHAYDDVQLTGDDGSEIPVASRRGSLELPVQSTVAGIEDLEIAFSLPSRNVTSIKKLTGQFTAMIPGREETFEFDNLKDARNVIRQRAGLRVTLDRVRKNGSLYEFRIRVRMQQAGQAFASHLDWASNNTVYLVSKDGERIDNPNFEKYLEREQEVGYAYLFPTSGDLQDYRLVYKTPAAIVNLPVKYELTDIPLP